MRINNNSHLDINMCKHTRKDSCLVIFRSELFSNWHHAFAGSVKVACWSTVSPSYFNNYFRAKFFGDTIKQYLIRLQFYKEHDRTSVKKPMETILKLAKKKQNKQTSISICDRCVLAAHARRDLRIGFYWSLKL